MKKMDPDAKKVRRRRQLAEAQKRAREAKRLAAAAATAAVAVVPAADVAVAAAAAAAAVPAADVAVAAAAAAAAAAPTGSDVDATVSWAQGFAPLLRPLVTPLTKTWTWLATQADGDCFYACIARARRALHGAGGAETGAVLCGFKDETSQTGSGQT